MLESGKQTSQFFEFHPPSPTFPQQSSFSSPSSQGSWKLKSLERYSKENSVQELPSKKYFSASVLGEIIRTYPISRKGLKENEIAKGTSFSFLFRR